MQGACGRAPGFPAADAKPGRQRGRNSPARSAAVILATATKHRTPSRMRIPALGTDAAPTSTLRRRRRGRQAIRGRSRPRAPPARRGSAQADPSELPTGTRLRRAARPPRCGSGSRAVPRRGNANDREHDTGHDEVADRGDREHDSREQEERPRQLHGRIVTHAVCGLGWLPADRSAPLRRRRDPSERRCSRPTHLGRDVTSALPRRPTCPSGTRPATRPLRRSTRPARWSSRAPATDRP